MFEFEFELWHILLIALSGGIGAYVAIRVDLARLHERIENAHDKIDHAHQRLDFVQGVLYNIKDCPLVKSNDCPLVKSKD